VDERRARLVVRDAAEAEIGREGARFESFARPRRSVSSRPLFGRVGEVPSSYEAPREAQECCSRFAEGRSFDLELPQGDYTVRSARSAGRSRFESRSQIDVGVY